MEDNAKIEAFIKKVNEDCFENAKINIKIVHNEQANPDRRYVIKKVYVKQANSCISIDNKIEKEINSEIENSNYNWNIFYFYKEIIQLVKEYMGSGTYYYRGQSDNWELAPGILRFKKKNNFEQIYKELSEKIEDLEYFGIKDDDNKSLDDDFFEKRNTELGILQHYGLPTPLIDITSNPFTALLFMCDGRKISNNYRRKRLDIFKIDDDTHSKENIFSRVYSNHRNKRIDAQKGEFLDFSKYRTRKHIAKIPHVSLVLEYEDTKKYNYNKERTMHDILDTFLMVNANEKLKKDTISKVYTKYGKELFECKQEMLERILRYKKKTDFEAALLLLSRYYKKLNDSDHDVRTAVDTDLNKKLEEYHYFEEDLYPDKYKKIEYTKRKYFL